MKRKIFVIILTLVFILTASHVITTYFEPGVAYAHSGRTDASGGHKDNKNKSGLGSYHYHCGGHPAHLHENGVCPYSSNAVAQDNTTPTKQSNSESKAANTQTNSSTQVQSDSLDYSCIYDEKTYIANNQDVYATIGDNSEALFQHFLDSGMKEGRIASSGFNVNVYKENNPDLQKTFGDDLKSYYIHYMSIGKKEGRIAIK